MAEGPVALLFPDVDVPAGWTSIGAGPRRWLLPPGATREHADARIVLVPLLPRKPYLTARLYLEDLLRAELRESPTLKGREIEDLATTAGMKGVFTEIAYMADPEHVREMRAYAVFADEDVFYTLFLQANPLRYEEMVPRFREVAASLRRLAADA